jgi:hypothetical protein
MHEACLNCSDRVHGYEYGQDEIYYGESELTEEVTEAIKEAGVRFVSKDSTTEGADRRYHYIHMGCLWDQIEMR